MPSRHFVLAIVVFWLATTGWLFYRDLRLRLLPGEPPPYTIDLADEADMSNIRWSVFKGDMTRPTGYRLSRVRYHEADDTFEIWGEFKLWLSGVMQADADIILEGRQSVTRDGELRAIDAKVMVKGIKGFGRIEGPVKDKKFSPRLTVEPDIFHISRDLPPVKLSERGRVLNPLQPVNRITGLRKGQHWREPFVDPLFDAVAAALSGILKQQANEIGAVEAEVLPDTYVLEWGRGLVPCLVIEYTGDDIQVRTWVRETDGSLLRQEVDQHGDKLVLQRDY